MGYFLLFDEYFEYYRKFGRDGMMFKFFLKIFGEVYKEFFIKKIELNKEKVIELVKKMLLLIDDV